MAVHPEITALLEQLAALRLPPLFSGPAPAARERIRAVVLGAQDQMTQAKSANFEAATAWSS